MADVRLIDANALNVKQWFASPANRKRMSEALNASPAIDAVPVVRCRDCKHAIINENHVNKPLICCLTKMVGTTKEDWFCADGERKMDGGAEG